MMKSFLSKLLLATVLLLPILGSGHAGAQDVSEQQDQARLSGSVTTVGGGPVAGVVVDFFEADPEGARGRWLGDESTDLSGRFSRTVEPGCYVLTYIAPAGRSFVDSGKYHQFGICAKPGQQLTNLDAQLSPGAIGPASLGGTVMMVDGGPVAGVVVDFFEADAVGGRSRWLGDETSDSSGGFSRTVDPGCYVLTYIAPVGVAFIGGGDFLEAAVCVTAGASVTVDAELKRFSTGCIIQGQEVSTPLSARECKALVELFIETDGQNWRFNRGWNTPTDPCSWLGVSCKNLELRTLSLQRLELAGSIPSAVGQLDDLRVLDLSNNLLSGPIPPELGHLAGLETLDLSFNQLSAVPPELGLLVAVTDLDLGDNRLTSLPSELGQLAALEFMDLSGNRLTSLPSELGQLNTVSLDLGENRLTALPPELGQASELERLIVDRNLITVIPPELGQLTNLRVLNLLENRLVTLPPELGLLGQLRELDISRNQLTSVPADLGQLGNLSTLLLSGNRLSALPPQLGQLSSLRQLSADGNFITEIPPEFGRLSALQALVMDENQLRRLPPQLGQLSQLEFLILSQNQITDLPAEIGGMSNLRQLRMSDNLLAQLPAELGQLPSLRSIELTRNRLSGDITAALIDLRFFSIELSDGPGGNNCLTVTDAALAMTLTERDPNWDECEP